MHSYLNATGCQVCKKTLPHRDSGMTACQNLWNTSMNVKLLHRNTSLQHSSSLISGPTTSHLLSERLQYPLSPSLTFLAKRRRSCSSGFVLQECTSFNTQTQRNNNVSTHLHWNTLIAHFSEENERIKLHESTNGIYVNILHFYMTCMYI